MENSTRPSSLPAHLIISTVKYSVKEYSSDVKIGDEDVSEIDLETNTISLAPKLAIEQQHLAILHESIHVMNWKFPEDTVELLSHALYSFMRENPEFIRQIIDG